MLQEYQDAVLACYQKKKMDGKLAGINLSNPTTAKLKRACLTVYDTRYTPEDDDILSSFFNVDKIEVDFRKVLLKANDGTFRALLNHLKDENIKTNERNSDLLAWLIDFKPRPSFLYYKYLREGIITENGLDIGSEVIAENPEVSIDDTSVHIDGDKETVPEISDIISDNDSGSENNTLVSYGNPAQQNFKVYLKIAAVSLSVLLVGSAFLFWKKKIDRDRIEDNEKCMIWTIDRFEAVDCQGSFEAQQKPLDLNRITKLRRIMSTDTLTKNSLGKVWYTKINGKPEFYTDSGMHPTNNTKKLNPLTPYILNKYVSYYRYLFIRLVWLLGIIVIVLAFANPSYKCFKKIKSFY